MLDENDLNKVVKSLTDVQYAHLERRFCEANSPMPLEDKDKYRWSHPDAVELREFFNLVVCECPHCKLVFSCLPRSN